MLIKFKAWDDEAIASTISFIAISVRNFAIGWALIGFFPGSRLVPEERAEVLIIGLVLMIISLILHIVAVSINRKKGDPE